jgi:hypothetical protein
MILLKVQHRPGRQKLKGVERKIPDNSKQDDRRAQRPNPARAQERLR